MKLPSIYNCLTVVLLFSMASVIFGCKKTEGVGGTSTIKGKIIVHDFDGGYLSPVPLAIYPATKQDTYIIYGENQETYDDDYKTSYDGSYEFKHLQKGHYRLFTYSNDTTGAKANMLSQFKIPVFIDVEITSNGSTVVAPDLIILDNKQ